MEKKLMILIIIFIGVIMGCQLNNTPTSKVEELLGNYQMLDESIIVSYVQLSNDEKIDSKYQERYRKVIEKQYRNMTYEIKDEKIDGNKAIVTTQIEVLNYKDVLQKNLSNLSNDSAYHENILNQLEKVKDKVTYTIDFQVVKNDKGEWNLDPLDDIQKEKLLGIN